MQVFDIHLATAGTLIFYSENKTAESLSIWKVNLGFLVAFDTRKTFPATFRQIRNFAADLCYSPYQVAKRIESFFLQIINLIFDLVPNPI